MCVKILLILTQWNFGERHSKEVLLLMLSVVHILGNPIHRKVKARCDKDMKTEDEF